MMRNKVILTVIVIAMVTTTYIFAIDQYDNPEDMLQRLNSEISMEGISYDEVEIELEGIRYKESLDFIDLEGKQDELVTALSHQENCSKLCRVSHSNNAEKWVKIQDDKKRVEVNDSGSNWCYKFTLNNERDIHENSYYHLYLTGKENELDRLEVMRSRGYDEFKSWNMEPKETICFKGTMKKQISKEKRSDIAQKLLIQLKATQTNYYEDDITHTTCAYYGYTPLLKQYISEADGRRTNIQISFKEDEISHDTKVIVAFPFYNEPF